MNHPQVAAFAREAKQNAIPTRKIEGQLSRLGRTVHDMMFDAIHDELVVPSPFAQAVLTFRGGADGEEPPIRIIQGPRTQIVAERGMDKVTIDAINNQDFAIVRSMVFLGSVLYIVGLVLTDISYTLVDPRVRFS